MSEPGTGIERRYSNHNVWFDYNRQCWVVEGKIHPCGHREVFEHCHACKHAGEPADRRRA
jgi:hypothetical protein